MSSNSNLLKAIGSTNFRFLDMSGVESQHSPKDREDTQTDDSAADKANYAGLTVARRGHAKVLDGDGKMVGWAKRNDKPIFDDAEKVLREAIRTANGLIRKCTIKVGGARAVPGHQYANFELAKVQCLEFAKNTNVDEHIIAANEILLSQNRPLIQMKFEVSWHPELTLSDPADIERAERIKQSVAEAIGQVVTACRSGDREQIRYVLDQVGALGDSISDPTLQKDVKNMLQAAETAAEKITAEGRARSATLRSNPESKRGQDAASRFLKVAEDAAQARMDLANSVNEFESRWAALDLRNEQEVIAENEDKLSDDDRYERMKNRLAKDDADFQRFRELEIDTEDRPLTSEALIEIESIKANEGIRQLEID